MINTYSNPTDLIITDMRFVDIDGAPKRCTILKIMTNQGITGYGEVRDASLKAAFWVKTPAMWTEFSAK